MSSFPNFSNVPKYVRGELNKRIKDPSVVNKYNAWVRISSAAGGGLSMISNPNYSLFAAAGEKAVYGSGTSSGTLGTTWAGSAIIGGLSSGGDIGYRPKPNVTSIEIDEGAGNLSRKASFTITAYTEAQLNTLCKYFLEPGYTIFLEWGWNVPDSLNAYSARLTAENVAENQSFTKVNEKRKKCNGMYDNYLGFITGGSISMEGSTWNINIKCTGFTELPAYLMASDNHEAEGDAPKDGEDEDTLAFKPSEISGESDLGKKRFKMMFNNLPSSRQSTAVKNLLSNKEIANAANFINFDENVKESLNSLGGGTEFFGLSVNDEEVSTGEGDVEVPSGTKLVGDESFIRFGTLMAIINEMGLEAFTLKNIDVKATVNSYRTVCSAFQKIFSTDKKKLLIPNKFTPAFSLFQAANTDSPQTTFTNTNDCSVKDGETIVLFPEEGKIENGVGKSKPERQLQPSGQDDVEGLQREAYTWGYLDNLYVNFDFVKPILESKNFSVKDAVYQILNGMSSAAGGMWDFQIIENESDDKKSTQLDIIELNLSSDKVGSEPVTFNVIGSDSIFMDASFDMEMSGAKMSQIIGNRLSTKMNGSLPSIKGNLFAKGMQDLVLTEIKKKQKQTDNTKSTTTGGTSEDEEKLKEKNLQLFLNKIGIYPKVEHVSSVPSGKLEEIAYVACYNDQVVFDTLKFGKDKVDETSKQGTSALLPIKFTFTIHGVSGITRGQKFKVNGIPRQYATGGFFQVTAVKHIVQDMVWKTEVEGGFRVERK
jgi:hypothetical protein